uniref:BPTI/Kunitz inhibitor domain-containing protein n=1 Tax=Varanus komodoensis TaxID=61221 RepID=A0A8D2LUT7_VARKO
MQIFVYKILAKTSILFSDARCLQPLTPGDCQDYQVKWYYASDANSCARFWYGGCKGNENRFETEEECQATCVAG